MLHEVSGDILLSNAEAIAHGVAANDPMDQGLALALHTDYPAMHKDYHHWCHTQQRKPGEAWIWASADGKRIINLITQEGGYGHGSRPGRSSVKHVNDGLRSLKKLINKENITSIAIPKLATGVGGLEWAAVKPLIENQLGDIDVTVYVYADFKPGQQAQEPA
jgi:O-acetyl-ADP-ribose deacetylase (regulator of RNase III)